MNRIKNLRWGFLAAILIVSGQIHGQAVISISPFLVPLPSSVALNTSLADTFYLYNTGDTGFSGIVTVNLSVNDSTPFFYNPPSDSAGITFDDTDSFVIGPHDSLITAVHIHFKGPDFSAGPSVVVIWPALSNESPPGSAIVGDSLKDTIQVLYPAAITGPLPVGLKVYTDNEQLFIKCDEVNALRHVRIFDVTGALILEQDLGATNSIPMGRFSDGIYLAELTLTNGQQITYKIFSGR
jgi:hypothetical protein